MTQYHETNETRQNDQKLQKRVEELKTGALTLEDIRLMSKFGHIKSIKPFCVEYDFTILGRKLTIEEHAKYTALMEKLSDLLQYDFTKPAPEVKIPNPVDFELDTQEGFIEFFSQFLLSGNPAPVPITVERGTNQTNEQTEEQPNIKRILVTFGNNPAQFVPTLKEWAGALLPQKNKKAYIAKLDKQLRFFWDENGNYKIDVADADTTFEEVSKSKPLPAKDTDTDLLYTLASAVEASYIKSYGYIITVRLPDFARAMDVRFENKDAAKDQKQYDFTKKLTDLENIIGVLVEQKRIEAAFKILSLDQTEKTLTFASPYLYSLMEIFENERIKAKEKKNNQPIWDIKGVSHLVSTKINSARNKVTAQVVYYIVSEIHRHGNKPDSEKKPQKTRGDNSTRTKTIQYSDIVKATPLLKEALREAKPSRRNQILTRVFFGDKYNARSSKEQPKLLEDYLRKYTKIFEYWKNLEISFDPVTMKSLDNCITITHHGINGDFKDFYQLPKVEDTQDILEES